MSNAEVIAAKFGVDLDKQGHKTDIGKIRYGLVAWETVREAAIVLTLGAQKYAPRNWEKGINYERVYSALIRHLDSWWTGEKHDPDTGRHHLAHAMCNVMFLLYYELFPRKYKKFDDRPKSP